MQKRWTRLKKSVLLIMTLVSLSVTGLVDGLIEESCAFGDSGHPDRSAIEEMYRNAEHIETVCRTPEGEALIRENLKERFSATEGSIAELRDQGLGYGEIAILHSLSRASGTEASRLLRMRVEKKNGMG